MRGLHCTHRFAQHCVAEVVDTAVEIPQLSMMETTDMVLHSDA